MAPEGEPTSTVNDGGGSSAASAEGGATAGRRGRKSKASASSVSAGTETQEEGNGMKDGGVGFGASTTQGAYVPVKEEEFWDLLMIIDVQTTDETEAKRELDCLMGLLRHEGLQISRRELLDESEGACGRVMCLCTASQPELEQEAEIMAISKSLKIPRDVAERFNKVGLFFAFSLDTNNTNQQTNKQTNKQRQSGARCESLLHFYFLQSTQPTSMRRADVIRQTPC